MPEEKTLIFENVTLYTVGMFGISRTDCRTLTLKTEQKYAQYNDAIRYQFLQKGKRKPRACVLADSSPWMRVVDTAHAIDPDDPLTDNGGGSKVSRYTSCDPRYITDFEDKLITLGIVCLFEVGYGRREKCMRCVQRPSTTEQGGSLVCGPCATAIRAEMGVA